MIGNQRHLLPASSTRVRIGNVLAFAVRDKFPVRSTAHIDPSQKDSISDQISARRPDREFLMPMFI